MHDVDFLPVEYRQEHAKRQWRLWRVLVVVGFGAILVVAALGQYRSHGRAQAELDAVLPKHQTALEQSTELARLQADLKAARSHAELYTYLRFPWPRSRILVALLKPLPKGINFEQLDIGQQKSRIRGSAKKKLSRADREAEKEKLKKLSPAERDLNRFHEEFDHAETVVTISGTTTDDAALHKYLGALNQAALFSKASLSAIEADDNDPAGTMRFSATIVVRPGYGKPGGPGQPAGDVAPQTIRHTTHEAASGNRGDQVNDNDPSKLQSRQTAAAL